MQDWFKKVEAEFSHPANILWRAIEMKCLEQAMDKYPCKAPVLDLGCAEGKIDSILFSGKKIYGLDNCWELIKDNQSQDVVLADACAIPFKSAIFSTVFSNCVIEHIPDLGVLLDEAGRVLSEGGIFIFTVTSEKFPRYLMLPWLGYGKFRMKWLNCFHCYGPDTWRKLLKERNLQLAGYSYYMSRRASFWWDFLAGSLFFLNLIRLGHLEKKITAALHARLKKIYVQEDFCDGAGLLLIATKAV